MSQAKNDPKLAYIKLLISTTVVLMLCFLFFRIKRGGALCIWRPCMVDLRDPKFWFKMVTEEISAVIFCPRTTSCFPHLKMWTFPLPSCTCIYVGGEIDCVDIHGNTPLHLAARCGQELLISSLLSNGADKTKWVHWLRCFVFLVTLKKMNKSLEF